MSAGHEYDSQKPDSRQQTEQREPAVACPFCRSHDAELVSLFGGQLSTDQYYCRACRSYFERFGRDAEDERG